jgi:hypothetical protein
LKRESEDQDLGFDEYDVMYAVKQKGWIIPAYKLPPKCQKTAILRVVVRENHSLDVLELLTKDLIETVMSLADKAKRTREKLLQELGKGESEKGKEGLPVRKDRGAEKQEENNEGGVVHKTGFIGVC